MPIVEICRSSFRIDNSGLSQVKAHASGDSHKKKEQLHAGKTTQRVFLSSSSNSSSISLSNQSLVLSLEDQPWIILVQIILLLVLRMPVLSLK